MICSLSGVIKKGSKHTFQKITDGLKLVQSDPKRRAKIWDKFCYGYDVIFKAGFLLFNKDLFYQFWFEV